ncbi:type II secretion system protein [Selenomonas ruminantium]|uniref:General secretion pathway protein G n=1 Tax=Selenomonas ruminantium TaxID=971 RepID=A0A1H0T5B8_SELRU|nr:type II secretion system protein [Selenomonas ruminantium]SDP48940.1 general secretion pathway protein G [Selenomonas ruminantium]
MREQDGFSLLGVLIAVAIVAVMASMAVPRFAATIATANTAKVQSDLAALDAAIAVYQLENGKDPQAVSDLKEYISDIGRLKPPHGDCKLSDGTVLPMTSGKYELKKVKEEGTNIENMRATCEGHTSGEFGHGGVKSEPAS